MTAVALRLLAALLIGLPYVAFAAPSRAKKPPAQISIENGRKVALTAFEIMPAPAQMKPGAKAPASPKPIAKLDAPLPGGKTKIVKLRGARGCSFVARWAFEDAGDEGPVDLCGDPKIVLTD